MTRGGRAPKRFLLTVTLIAVLVSACESAAPRISVLPVGTSPSAVLNTYLRSLVAGNCADARLMATSTFTHGNGELCGDTTVSAFTIDGDPASPTDVEVVFATTLTTTGTADGSVPPGKMTWFYQLKRQPNGAWLLAGGGTGP